MSFLYRRTGIILNRKNVGSVDRKITFLSVDGKRELRARGTQKLASKLAGSLEPLTLVDLTVAHGKTADQITGSTVRNRYRSIHANVPAIAGASLLASSADALIRGVHEEREPYRRVREAFALLGRSRTNRELFLSVGYGLWSLIASLGYAPRERDLPPRAPVRRLVKHLLRGDARLVRRIRCSVGTARGSVEASIAFTEALAERSLPAGEFFQRIFSRSSGRQLGSR